MEKIAIIGGGFAGVCTAVHLIEDANCPLKICIIEKSALCKGVAYGTKYPFHPLNVRADQMGLFADKPGHFFHWLESRQSHWRKIDPSFAHLELDPENFMPRLLYSAYIQDVFQQAQSAAVEKGIECEIIKDAAIDAELNPDGTLTISLAHHKSIKADRMVLAIGTPPIRVFAFETKALRSNPRYTGNIWNPHLESLFHNMSSANREHEPLVVIIGSGLTAIDSLFTLNTMGYTGKILMISGKGSLPQVHTLQEPPLISPFKITESKSVLQLFRAFRKALKEADDPEAWRQIITANRPYFQVIWRSLPMREKKRFLRHLFNLWNKHRHRMSPQSYGIVKSCQKNNGLEILPGYVQDVIALPDDKLQVSYRLRKADHPCTIVADHVINCSGPEYLIAKHPEPLLQNLLKKGMVLPDELGMGLKLAEDQKLEGKNGGRIYGIGLLLFGELFETIAVPELRQEAQIIAKNIKQDILDLLPPFTMAEE